MADLPAKNPKDHHVASTNRISRVRSAVESWVRKMADFTGRNRLLFFRELKAGTLMLPSGTDWLAADAADRIFAGKAVMISELIRSDLDEDSRERQFKDLSRRSKTLYRKSKENLEERGIDTLHIGYGLFQWDAKGTTSSSPNAPVLLTPLTITRKSASSDDYKIALGGATEINPTLVQYLQRMHSTTIDAEALLEACYENDVLDFDRLKNAFLAKVGHIEGARWQEGVVIGNFATTKQPMMMELEACVEILAEHDLVAAIAGDPTAIQSLRSAFVSDVSLDIPDEIEPASEFLVLDADSSQNHAINRALRGESLVIQGPPGTGKSQTIANLIASLTAVGKRVLFVAEKRAAIEAVGKNLDKVGLSDLMMDLHASKVRKADVAKALKAALDTAKHIQKPDAEGTHQRLRRNRGELVAYAKSLHAERPPFAVTYHQALLALLDLQTRVKVQDRVPAPSLHGLDQNQIAGMASSAADVYDLGLKQLIDDKSPLLQARVTSAEDCDAVLQEIQTMEGTLANLEAAIGGLCGEFGLEAPEDMVTVNVLLQSAEELAELESRHGDEVFEADIPEAIADLKLPAHPVLAFLRKIMSSKYTDAARTAKELLQVKRLGEPKQTKRQLQAIQEVLDRWASLAGVAPKTATGIAACREAKTQFEKHLGKLEAHLRVPETAKASFTALREYTASFRNDAETSGKYFILPKVHQLIGAMPEPFRDLTWKIVASANSPKVAEDMFAFVCWSSLEEHFRQRDTVLAAYSPDALYRCRDAYSLVDHEHLHLAAKRVRRSVAEHTLEARNAYSTEDQVVKKQAALKRRHMPVRKLLNSAPHVIGSLKPCWAMSPLIVSRLLPAHSGFFDVVIFDEASQVEPGDAIPAIMRAKQVIVAGDSKQLPPTTFFASGDADGDGDDEEEESASLVVGFESILDVLNAALPMSANLLWHYRSRDERLINFSNAHLYDNSLKTFPGISGARCLRHIKAPDEEEAFFDAVLDAIFEHVKSHPDRSLGVITLGVNAANRFDDRLQARLRALSVSDRAHVESFFDESRAESFFVKNIERVQGDERDDIILVTRLARRDDGRVLNRLAALNHRGGERRLNVAVTRSRRSMTLITNFTMEEMPASSFSSTGANLVREYVRYAKKLGNNLGDGADTSELNAFEIAVRDRLQGLGIPLICQFGVAGYRIDFAACHPEDPSRPVLAIEADGAMYHSSPTARDRDRLRQQVLEGLGWRFHRIWSTAWFLDPEKEAQRCLEAWKKAVSAADAGAPPPSMREAPVEPQTTPEPTAQAEQTIGQSDRSRCPVRVTGGPITDYSHRDLVVLVEWIASDGILRSDDEIVAEAVKELGYKKKGSRIVTKLKQAITAKRR